MARRGKVVVEPEPEDMTAWMLNNGFAEFVLMHTNEIVSGLINALPAWKSFSGS
jgi:hypothetical protein